MPNVTITPGTGHVNLSPLMFHEYATQYLECERLFTTRQSYSPVPYFLICRAIELELKSRHLQAISRAEVKRYGHNLCRSYDQLPAPEKKLDAGEYAVLVQASAIYDVPNKGFEYVTVWDAVTGLRDFPDIGMLRGIAAKLLER